MNSSRSTTIGIGLIIAIFLGWFILNQPKTHKPVTTPAQTTDSAHAVDTTPAKPTATAAITTDSAKLAPHSGGLFDAGRPLSAGVQRIETPLYTAEISSKGGAISSWVLKQYKTWDKKPLDLVNHEEFNGGDVNLKFVAEGRTIDTKDLPFTVENGAQVLRDSEVAQIKVVYAIDSNRSIEKIFHLSASKYAVGIEYHLKGMQDLIAGYHYNAVVENALPYAEQKTASESAAALASAGMKGGPEEIDATKPTEPLKKEWNGDLDYVASRTQYFIQALIPMSPKATAAQLSGTATPAKDGGNIEKYQVGVTIPAQHQADEVIKLNYYLGPLEYDRIQAMDVGLERTMNFGWSFVVRPISIHLMLPLLMWIHGFFSNWGIVIILFSILIKLITVPLSTGQMRSMRKMQVLQPKVAELRERMKDDPKKQNEELMKLYRTYGVNPAGGCLPMVLQMPILFALYAVLRNVIQLRQAPLGLWIHDLSIPDGLFHFGGSVPILGNQLSGLTLLLGATMLLQQMFTVTDPKQKMMAYMMPLIFTFMFNNLPSGVALYYFMFNIFGLAQQFYLAKIATPPSLESMRVDPKKKPGLMSRLQNMEQASREQRRDQYTGKKGGKKK
jgi:YidC/Oxa1 family membrane protein insertase